MTWAVCYFFYGRAVEIGVVWIITIKFDSSAHINIISMKNIPGHISRSDHFQVFDHLAQLMCNYVDGGECHYSQATSCACKWIHGLMWSVSSRKILMLKYKDKKWTELKKKQRGLSTPNNFFYPSVKLSKKSGSVDWWSTKLFKWKWLKKNSLSSAKILTWTIKVSFVRI